MKKIILLALLALLGMSQAVAQEDDEINCLLLVREGVKWVNEKVIIDHGDTTSYYYTYEFSGYDTDPEEMNLSGDINNALYYYTGQTLDVEKDSLIAGLQERAYLGESRVTCFRNNAYKKVFEEHRNMLPRNMYTDGGTILLYWFGENAYINYTLYICFTLQEFMSEDRQFLTTDNFMAIDPIEIEGKTCCRCAYVNEQGDTLAIFVQGIGFDSRDLGDLLTPFTRKPDPDADYQEWCGLSHVIMDGQIIYKGLRYREGAFDGISEVADGQTLQADGNYYDLMGRAVGKDVPTTPGIYIHQGKKIVIR